MASCSVDKTIKLFNITGNNYNILQTLKYHTGTVYKIIELKNKQLVSCSYDKTIIFYSKENNEYKKDYNITTNGGCSSVIQTKIDEICYSEYKNNAICFFNISERNIKKTISNISKRNDIIEKLFMITNELLFIGGENKISIVNVNNYKLVNVIDIPGSSYINAICMLNENIFLTGDNKKIIRQWKIEGDNIKLISKKEKTLTNRIYSLVNLGDGHIATGSDDNTIKIW